VSGVGAPPAAGVPRTLRCAAVLIAVLALGFAAGGIRSLLSGGAAVMPLVRVLLVPALLWLVRGLRVAHRRAWVWSVAFCSFRIVSWLAFALVIARTHDEHWSASPWFAPRMLIEQSPVLAALVLLLLPASRRGLRAKAA